MSLSRRGVLCAFPQTVTGAPSSSTFATVSTDNRIRVWDLASGKLRQQYAEEAHLSAEYTCVAYSTSKVRNKAR